MYRDTFLSFLGQMHVPRHPRQSRACRPRPGAGSRRRRGKGIPARLQPAVRSLVRSLSHVLDRGKVAEPEDRRNSPDASSARQIGAVTLCLENLVEVQGKSAYLASAHCTLFRSGLLTLQLGLGVVPTKVEALSARTRGAMTERIARESSVFLYQKRKD